MPSEQPKYAFKGVWIPKEIWESTEISWMEKCLLADIDALDDGDERGCFASNEYFAEKFRTSAASIANQISKLRKLGLVETIGFDGRERRLRLTCRLRQEKPASEARVNPQVKAHIRESKGEDNTPLPPKGGEAGEEGSGQEKTSPSIKSKVPTSEPALRIAALFNRRNSTEWSDKEIKAFKKLMPINLDDLQTVEDYYAAERKKGGDGIHRRDLGTFLNNFYGELDRARAWKENPKANEKSQKTTRANSTDRNAGTFNAGGSESFAGVQKFAAPAGGFAETFARNAR